jgi:hypothetical protein
MATEISLDYLHKLLVSEWESITNSLESLNDSYEEQERIELAQKKIKEIYDALPYIFQYSANSGVWKHIADLDSKTYFENFGNYETITKDEVKDFIYEKVNDYFSQSLIKFKEIDWFYLDFITAVSYRVNANKLSDLNLSEIYPNLYSAIQKYDDKGFFPLFKLCAWTLVKWAVALYLLVVMFGMASSGNEAVGYIAVALILLRIYLFYRDFTKFSLLEKISKQKLAKLKKLYAVFNDKNLHWDLIEQDVRACRDCDLELPIALHTAIKRK